MSSRYVAEISSVRRDRDTNLFCIITFINQPFETSWPRSTTRRLIDPRCLHFAGEGTGVSDRILRGKRRLAIECHATGICVALVEIYNSGR